MTTFKERQEAKQARYKTYSQHAQERSQEAINKSHALLDAIPFGQPVLVGHHSESSHRNRLKRADNAMRKCCEESDKAKYWESRARHIPTESQVENMGFAVGDVGIARWTNCNCQYQSAATIVKINAKSMIVKLSKEVVKPAYNGYPEHVAYPFGWSIKIALTQSGGFTDGNSFRKEE